jgi:hypothetical protein
MILWQISKVFHHEQCRSSYIAHSNQVWLQG